jgi:hypothetical protein
MGGYPADSWNAAVHRCAFCGPSGPEIVRRGTTRCLRGADINANSAADGFVPLLLLGARRPEFYAVSGRRLPIFVACSKA